ncbi:MAG: DUF805 domain-containing protein [Dehalococcoidia bacterium]|jgi:uncharacterized membrane protein YhaH (DUF805 family)|nr:DUF805 domain-containing protein [Dehalococcoidia bacterium]
MKDSAPSTPLLLRTISFRGRSSRREYWSWVLSAVLLHIVFAFLRDGLDIVDLPLNEILFLVTLLPGTAVAVRRLHDTNRSGLRLLWPIGALVFLWSVFFFVLIRIDIGSFGLAILIIGPFLLLFLGSVLVLTFWLCLPGDSETNRHGPPARSKQMPADDLTDSNFFTNTASLWLIFLAVFVLGMLFLAHLVDF